MISLNRSVKLPKVLSIACLSITLMLWWGLDAIGAAGPAGGMQGLTPIPGKPQAPAFAVPDLQGNMQSLADYRGKVVIVNFWATWCAPCRKEMPSMQRAWEKVQDQGAVLLAINWKDSEDFIDEFLKAFPHTLEFPILMDKDGSVASEYGVKGLPATFIIDPQGHMVYRAIGEREWDDPELLEQILALKE